MSDTEQTDKYGKLVHDAAQILSDELGSMTLIHDLVNEAATLATGRQVHTISEHDDVNWYAEASAFMTKVLMSTAMMQAWVRDDSGKYFHLQEDHDASFAPQLAEQMTVDRYHEILHEESAFTAARSHPKHDW